MAIMVKIMSLVAFPIRDSEFFFWRYCAFDHWHSLKFLSSSSL